MDAPMKARLALALAATTLALAAPAAAATAWTLDVQPTTAALVIGEPRTPNAFRMDCSGGKMSLSTWTRRLPRNITEGEFPSRLSVFQGNTELVLGGTGRVLPEGGTRVDALVADRDAFLRGVGQNRLLTVVTFAGRAKATAPTAEQLEAFRQACAAR
jgi:hypothetical protein